VGSAATLRYLTRARALLVSFDGVFYIAKQCSFGFAPFMGVAQQPIGEALVNRVGEKGTNTFASAEVE